MRCSGVGRTFVGTFYQNITIQPRANMAVMIEVGIELDAVKGLISLYALR